MRKIFIIVLSIVLCLSFFITKVNSVTTNEQPSRILNVVYDDSGSTIRDDNQQYVDTWCQTKYAMEVFAGLLEERDTLNIFPMSTNGIAGSNANIISVIGSESIEQRVSKIHDMQTEKAGDTPFQSVVNAYNHLINQKADQRWLIVLTDGIFDNDSVKPDDLNATFRNYTDNNINVVFLSIGSGVDLVTTDAMHHIYAEHAANSSEIIDKITMIANYIFERNILSDFDINNGEFSFDVSMSQLIVFAQGDNVEINDIKGADGNLKKVSEVYVSYSDKVAKNYEKYRDKIVVATGLKGTIAVFESNDHEIGSGSYKLDVSGAQKVEIYYKPDVDVGIRIFQDGKDVTDNDALEAGGYSIKVGFVDEDGDGFIESDLLGDISYDASIVNNENEVLVASDGQFDLETGDVLIDLQATYLKYNHTTLSKQYEILAKVIPLELSVNKNDTYNLKELEESSMTLTVKHDGNLLSKDQWETMELPEVTSEDNVDFSISRGDEVSTFDISLRYQDGNRFDTATGDVDFTVSAKLQLSEYLASGDISDNITINDDRNIIDWIVEFLINWYKWLIASWIIFCFIMKLRGPTGLFKNKIKPNVEMTKYEGKNLRPRDVMRRHRYYKMKRQLWSCIPITPISIRAIIPIRHQYCRQSAPDLKVKSTGKNLIILNKNDFNPEYNKNLCSELEYFSTCKLLSINLSLVYYSTTSIQKGINFTNEKSSFTLRLK